MNHEELDKRFDELYPEAIKTGKFSEAIKLQGLKQFIHQEIEQAVQEAEKKVVEEFRNECIGAIEYLDYNEPRSIATIRFNKLLKKYRLKE